MNKNMKKRIALIGMYGLLTSTALTACGNKQEKISASTLEVTGKNNPHRMEDANGEIQTCSEVTIVTYENETKETNCLLMGLESLEDNKRVYRSFSAPEISLMENYDEENYTTNYMLHCDNLYPEEKNEEFTKNCSVISVVTIIGLQKNMSYQEIIDYEEKARERQQDTTDESINTLSK